MLNGSVARVLAAKQRYELIGAALRVRKRVYHAGAVLTGTVPMRRHS